MLTVVSPVSSALSESSNTKRLTVVSSLESHDLPESVFEALTDIYHHQYLDVMVFSL